MVQYQVIKLIVYQSDIMMLYLKKTELSLKKNKDVMKALNLH